MGAPPPDSYVPSDYYDDSTYDLQTQAHPTFSSKITVAAVLSLFFVLLLLSSVHIFGRWLWRLRRRSLLIERRIQSRHQRAHFAAAPLRSAGLSQAVISMLPTFAYSAAAGDGSDASESASLLECAVCLSEFQEGEQGRLLPACKHRFHTDCIDMWFFSHSTCPLCRTVVAEPTAMATSPSSVPSTHDIEQQQSSGAQEQAIAYEIHIVIDTTSSTPDIDNAAAIPTAAAATAIPSLDNQSSDGLFSRNSSCLPSPIHTRSTHDSGKTSPPASSKKRTTRSVPRITIEIPTRQDIAATSPAFLSLPSRRPRPQVSPLDQSSSSSSSHASIKSPGIRGSLNRIRSMQSARGKSIAVPGPENLDSSKEASRLAS